ncbi:hypothetical protein CHUAL_006322 [Chamberlinius hualienensis]
MAEVDLFSSVNVENVNKTFTAGLVCRKRTIQVLRGINLNVQSSSIYGLLGPSGCGKTTLLKCIIGRLKPNSGQVTVFGQQGIPGNQVGYMPQDIALTEELTIKETFNYFGKTAGMTDKQISNRSQFLLRLLHLESHANQFIGNLSGGQKRRASFAVAIIHQPPLVILDEPTVGLDPIMRQNVWEHLTSVVSSSTTTILITTHYVEEANKADKVGLMLHGRLVADDAPQRLLQKYNSNSLEDVFLAISLELVEDSEGDESSKKPSEEGEKFVSKAVNPARMPNNANCRLNNGVIRTRPNFNVGLKNGFQLAIARFYALLVKTIIFSCRNPASIVLEVLVPPLLLIAFSSAVGLPLFDLKMGVVNHDQFELGNLYLDTIDKHTIHLIFYENLDEARPAYTDGEIWGIIEIQRNFTEALTLKTERGILSEEFILEQSTVNVILDISSSQMALTIHSELLSALGKFSKKLMDRMGFHPELTSIPIKVNGQSDVMLLKYNQFLMPGFVLALTYFTAMGATALNRSAEKQMGCMDRYYVAGVSAFDFVFSELFVHLLLFLLEGCMDFMVIFWLFGFDCKGSIALAFAMTVLHGVSGMSFGILVSILTDYVVTAVITCIAVFFIGIMLQGVMWPLEGVPYIIRYLSMGMPSTLPVQSMRDIINRGWGIGYVSVKLGILLSIVWSVVLLSVCVVTFHLKI